MMVGGFAHGSDFALRSPTLGSDPIRVVVHTCPLFPAAGEPAGGAIQLRMKDLKAVEGKRAAGQKVEVTFANGHVLVGTTLGYDPGRPGLFITPLDPHGNTVRVFVVSEAVTRVHQL